MTTETAAQQFRRIMPEPEAQPAYDATERLLYASLPDPLPVVVLYQGTNATAPQTLAETQRAHQAGSLIARANLSQADYVELGSFSHRMATRD